MTADRTGRRTCAVVALAFVALMAVAGCDGGDGGDGTAGRASSSANPTSAPAVTPSAAPTEPASSPTAAVSPAFDGTVIRVVVRAGKVETAQRVVSVARGTKVRLQVSSDVADEVHVHSYDLSENVPAGGTITIDFVATIPGTVKVELEERELVLVELKTT